ncbi:MAG: hypothetical protein COW65_08390 [Cytophagales bacterium CG18_big_fil_WC_8_21_14_2_50_42_9]|nr:MAG: hypothetical protein COW65_08390 [Cytophagales bacterium CG18_big_fil_WC_8_21_14_2_50_42_9]
MEITKEEFDDKIRETMDDLILAMAEHEDINPEKFYSMTCILENLAFFSPVIYGALRNSKKT